MILGVKCPHCGETEEFRLMITKNVDNKGYIVNLECYTCSNGDDYYTDDNGLDEIINND